MQAEAVALVRSRGFVVFPADPVLKKPCQATGPRHAANVCTTTEDVAAAWTDYPRGRIGVSCHASHVLVVDIDGPTGEESWTAALAGRAEPVTLTATTGRTDGGRHLYFTNPDNLGCSRGSFGPGIDIRGSGGFVIAPPSLHSSGVPYRWVDDRAPILALPAWITAKLYVAPAPVRPPRSTRSPGWRDNSPVDIANARGSFEKLLHDNGWEEVIRRGQPYVSDDGNAHWTRPGKSGGTSGTLQNRLFYCWSSSVPELKANKAYSFFGLFTALEHGGDFTAASAALRFELAS